MLLNVSIVSALYIVLLHQSNRTTLLHNTQDYTISSSYTISMKNLLSVYILDQQFEVCNSFFSFCFDVKE